LPGWRVNTIKIAYITSVEILDLTNTGGIQCCKRNLNLLQQAFGEDNVFICAITKNKKLLTKKTGNTEVFYSNRNKISILKNILTNRLQFGRDVEQSVLEHVNSLDCDIVFIEFSRMGFLQKSLSGKVKQVLFLHNIEKNYIKNQIRVHPSRAVLKKAFNINESMAVKYADKIICLNNRDAEQLEEIYNRKADLIIPITFDDSYISPAEESRQNPNPCLQLLFVGSLFPPNEHGITWFVNEVMPYVDAEFTVVGRDFEKLRDKLSRSNVNVVGSVDDLSVYYNNADAIVSPILIGDGMKVKTAEALMYGKPMFATDEALEGYTVEGQKNIYRCNTSEEFILEINKHAKESQRTGFDKNLRDLFLEKYHTPGYISVLKELLF